MGQALVAEDVEPRHDIDEVADVADEAVPEDQGLAFGIDVETLDDVVDGLAEAFVEVGDGVLEAFLDEVLDIALDAVRVAGGEVGEEVIGIGDGDDPVLDREAVAQRVLRGVVPRCGTGRRGRCGPGPMLAS